MRCDHDSSNMCCCLFCSYRTFAVMSRQLLRQHCCACSLFRLSQVQCKFCVKRINRQTSCLLNGVAATSEALCIIPMRYFEYTRLISTLSFAVIQRVLLQENSPLKIPLFLYSPIRSTWPVLSYKYWLACPNNEVPLFVIFCTAHLPYPS